MKIINTVVSSSDQNVNYLQHLDIDGRKVRIDIRSNPYKFQSHARLEVLSPTEMKWNVVVFRPNGNMETETGLYVRRGVTAEAFVADRRWLLDTYAALVPSDAPVNRSGIRFKDIP